MYRLTGACKPVSLWRVHVHGEIRASYMWSAVIIRIGIHLYNNFALGSPSLLNRFFVLVESFNPKRE